MSLPSTQSEPWHLDRKVPIAMIVALDRQAGTAIGWASRIENRQQASMDEIARVDRESRSQDAQIEALRISTQNLAVSAATVGTQMSGVTNSLNEIKTDQREIYELLRQMNGYRSAPDAP